MSSGYPRRPARRPRRAAAALGLPWALSALLLLSACTTGSGSGSGSDSGTSAEEPATPSATESASAGPYLEVPDEVELTPAGTQLSLGEPATVAYEPKQGKVGVVRLRVTRIERGRIKDLAAFKLDAATRKATPFYVSGVARNTGEANLSGTMLPLYLADDQNRLITASRFKSSFERCPSAPFDKGFKPGTRQKGCWVYLADADSRLTGISYYPVDGFDPITWTGEVTRPKAAAKKTGKKGG